MNLALGTVQFGLNYGISNHNGKVDSQSALAILKLATANKIDTLDTAIAYGDSEVVIGNITQHLNDKFNIITKLTSTNAQNVRVQVESSIKRLKTESIYAVLLHDAEELLATESASIFQALIQLKKEGLCQKIGVSVYSPKQLTTILKHYPIDIVQIPLNILDQEFNKPEFIALFKKNNIEVHARSLFLQGLLLMNFNHIPPYFSPFKEHLLKLHSFCEKNALTQLEACFSFAKSMSFVDKFVVGVSSLKELSEILAAYSKTKPIDFKNFSVSNKSLINPSLWPIKK